MTAMRAGVRTCALAIVALIALLGCTRAAVASGDSGCLTSWKLLHRDFTGCSNTAFLSPANDSRVNLLLLMADLRKAKPANAEEDTPLFEWADVVMAMGSAADQTATDGSAADAPVPCPASLPASDPFAVAVKADAALKPEERDALLTARAKSQSGCANDVTSSAVAAAKRAATCAEAHAYVGYLEAAAAFWRESYDEALPAFQSLRTSPSPWVKETATYMVGRTLIKRLQTGAFDEYGSIKQDWKADPKSTAAGEAALDDYLRKYPDGAYALSARGLKRRGYWLADDTAKLEEEYGALIMMTPEQRNCSDVDLVQEIDSKLMMVRDVPAPGSPGAVNSTLLQLGHNPLLLAMLDLLAMRTSDDEKLSPRDGAPYSTISAATLEAQKPYFAGNMPLYEYLLAARAFYVDHRPAEVLRLIPDAARQSSFSYVQFSRQMLRGMALEAMKDPNALGFWKQMIPGAKAQYQRPVVELAIAYHDERSGQIRDVFAAGSLVEYPYLREVLLAKVADADLLRMQATNKNAPKHEREVALYTLLYKEATLGHAVEFLKDLALVPGDASSEGSFTLLYGGERESWTDNTTVAPIPLGIFLQDKTEGAFGCKGLRSSEEQLATDPENTTAELCVADFVRVNSPFNPPADMTGDELGDTPSLFAGGDYVRMDTYKSVIASAKASRNDKAYALYRAVNCYAPSGLNDCGGKEVPKAQRKAWFVTLKKNYAGTRWADDLQYYW